MRTVEQLLHNYSIRYKIDRLVDEARKKNPHGILYAWNRQAGKCEQKLLDWKEKVWSQAKVFILSIPTE